MCSSKCKSYAYLSANLISSIEGVVQYWAIGRREDDTHMYIIASKEVFISLFCRKRERVKVIQKLSSLHVAMN